MKKDSLSRIISQIIEKDPVMKPEDKTKEFNKLVLGHSMFSNYQFDNQTHLEFDHISDFVVKAKIVK